MASSNNGARDKKQKRTALVDSDSSSSSLLSSPVHIISLSFGNVLQHFPDLLLQILSYIADRTVFNAIAFSNRDIYEKSKAILPPWPIRYKLEFGPYAPLMTWSPCGTRIACRFGGSNILIYDQQRGPYRDNRNDNHNTGWLASRAEVTALKFSPDGSFLVSTCDYGIVKLWDNVTGNYELLQRWNIPEEIPTNGWIQWESTCCIDVSPCSKYIIVAPSSGNRILFKSVENGGTTIKTLSPQPIIKCITKIMFSVDDCAVLIYGKEGSINDNVVMLWCWRPYLDDANKDTRSFIPLQSYHNFRIHEFILSRDNAMIAMYDTLGGEGRILSFDENKNCQTQIFTLPRNVPRVNLTPRELIVEMGLSLRSLLYFTPDNKYILCSTRNNELKYWSVAEGKLAERKHLFNNENDTNSLTVVNVSPNNRQLIVRDKSMRNDRYIIYSF